ncbi:uncharacterized protein LOC122007083 [Zingiber officinale]|uniref:uncharacterized protein LOC122007083 n=1 Tax=Zingiber officinale TaxID=94328 RepID=UPI001C4DB78D|nr:uncharacterized protein LOC122007083 [Zingiber officinale]
MNGHTSGSAVHGDAVEAIKVSSLSPSHLLLLLRLQQIVAIASEAARQSLKKKGLHVPLWRRHEYMRTKWFSAYQRAAAIEEAGGAENNSRDGIDSPCLISTVSFPRTADESCGKEVMRPASIEVAGSPWKTAPTRKKSPTGLALVLESRPLPLCSGEARTPLQGRGAGSPLCSDRLGHAWSSPQLEPRIACSGPSLRLSPA